jgi:hypothetical protein
VIFFDANGQQTESNDEYAGGAVFGFSHLGYVTTIDVNSGTACLAVATPAAAWAGAGITTSAL